MNPRTSPTAIPLNVNLDFDFGSWIGRARWPSEIGQRRTLLSIDSSTEPITRSPLRVSDCDHCKLVVNSLVDYVIWEPLQPVRSNLPPRANTFDSGKSERV